MEGSNRKSNKKHLKTRSMWYLCEKCELACFKSIKTLKEHQEQCGNLTSSSSSSSPASDSSSSSSSPTSLQSSRSSSPINSEEAEVSRVVQREKRSQAGEKRVSKKRKTDSMHLPCSVTLSGNRTSDDKDDDDDDEEEESSSDNLTIQVAQSSLSGYAKTFVLSTNSKNLMHNPRLFLNKCIPHISSTIEVELKTSQALKYMLWLEVEFTHPSGESTERNFKSTTRTVFQTSTPEQTFESLREGIQSLETEMGEHEGNKSGWMFKSVKELQVRVSKCSFFRLSGKLEYFKLPKSIAKHKACLNVYNHDVFCFKHAIISKLYAGNKNPVTQTDMANIAHDYNFANLIFPITISEIKKFENRNPGVSVNVFACNKDNKIFPLKVVERELADHFDLLLVSDNEHVSCHYVLIKDFNKLIRAQLTQHKGKIEVCKRCFTFQRKSRAMTNNHWLEEHAKYCKNYKPCQVSLPTMDKENLYFSNPTHHHRIPIVVYGDIESTLRPIQTCEKEGHQSSTTQTALHEANSFCLTVKSSLPEELLEKWNINSKQPYLYRGDNIAFKLISYLRELAVNVSELYKTNIPLGELTEEEQSAFDTAVRCALCDKEFCENVKKNTDHDHLTGKVRGTYCSSCNVNIKVPSLLPVVMHNLSGYDSHFLIQALGLFENRTSLIPTTTEKFLSFSVYIKGIEVRFIDSLKFTSKSLELLVKTLPREKLFETRSLFESSQEFELCTRKGIYPYRYIDSVEKFKDTSLPPIECFYNDLTESPVSDADYLHAQKVWTTFKFKNLGEYHNHYLKTDTMILCDVMEEFRNLCFTNYKLDPFYYYSAPGFSWNAMLLSTKAELKLITDYDCYMFVEAAIRGGFVQCVQRYAVANNELLENKNDYNPSKEKTYIEYFDAINLYGAQMMQPLPYANFKFVKSPEFVDWKSLPKNSKTGYILECDVEYPIELHDLHNDFPLMPSNQIPPSGKQKKLIASLTNKTSYIAHYRVFQQAEQLGLKVSKAKRALQFNQSCWLKPYIEQTTKLRQAAKNEFEKDFWKLIVNSVYGYSLMDKKKHINMKLVSTKEAFLKEASKNNYLESTLIGENLVAVKLGKQRVELNRPIYIGQCILDLAKVHMSHFHYNVMKKEFKKIKLLYTDTDSLIYAITTNDLITSLSKLNKHFDLSSYHKNSELQKVHLKENTKKIGKFKNETEGRAIYEFIGLKSKMYTYRFTSKEEEEEESKGTSSSSNVYKKAKGVKSSCFKSQVLFQNYKDALLKGQVFYAKFNTIRSRNHVLFTEAVTKLALTAHDDKRYIKEDGIHTLAYGHYSLTKQNEASTSVRSERTDTHTHNTTTTP